MDSNAWWKNQNSQLISLSAGEIGPLLDITLIDSVSGTSKRTPDRFAFGRQVQTPSTAPMAAAVANRIQLSVR